MGGTLMKPADCLAGLTLDGAWTVVQQIVPPSYATGGHFSVGYLAEHVSGRRGYLKALDFSGALQTPDPVQALQSMTAAYIFERNLLTKCKNRKLDRIVASLADGIVKVPGNFGPLENVCYLIFEHGEGTLRNAVAQFTKFDLAWCLRSLHHTSVGLRQLHSAGIAHP